MILFDPLTGTGKNVHLSDLVL